MGALPEMQCGEGVVWMAEANISTVRRLVQDSKYLVVISGSGMQREGGHQSIRDQERAYDIEAEYGYSPEEMFSSAFYNTRTESFYNFYKKEILSRDLKPGPAHAALAKLERKGILKTIITREIHGLCRDAGCKNVIELHGYIGNNHCPRCGRTYTKQYMRDAKKVPLCEDCMLPIRPGIRLFGELVDNSQMTRVANEITKADVLLILGARLDQEFYDHNLSYYKGDKVILLTNRENHGDVNADYVIHGGLNELVPQLL